MLILKYDNRPFFRKAGTYAIRAFAGFIPKRTFRQSPLCKITPVGRMTVCFKDQALGVGQNDAASCAPRCLEEPLQIGSGDLEQEAVLLARLGQFTG